MYVLFSASSGKTVLFGSIVTASGLHCLVIGMCQLTDDMRTDHADKYPRGLV